MKRYVKYNYPDADVVILAGSAAYGTATAGSDLDVVIFDHDLEYSYRIIDEKYGRIFEVFLVSLKHYPLFLEEAQKSGIPSIIRMCMDGIVIVDRGGAADIVSKARDTWREGPFPRTDDELTYNRCEITEYLDDLRHSHNRSEDLFIMNKLMETFVEFILRANGCWLGVGKWAYRALEHFDPALAAEFVRVTDLFYQTGNRKEFVDFIHEILSPYGGESRTLLQGASFSEE